MMRKIRSGCFFFLILLYSLPVSSQQANDGINVSKINFDLIESLYSKKLNALRKAQNCTDLYVDPLLKKAGKDQADYMLKNNLLTHNQKNKEKETPQKRVFFYAGTNDLVGENCIMVYLKKPSNVSYSKTPITANTYEEAAEMIFQGWKNSPGHYKNMITKEYDVQGLGFAYRPEDGVLYSSQVFGAKSFNFPPGCESPGDAFHILPATDAPCKCFDSGDGRTIMGDLLVGVYGDSAYFKSEKLELLKHFFNDPKDAIYFDIVLREQFVCEKNNLLHGSPVFDGCMLKPILFSEIFRRNQARGGKNLYATVAVKIPAYYKGKHININHGIVKRGYSCMYVWPHTLPAMNLEILTLFPKWLYQRNVVITPDTFRGQLTFVLPFERGKTTLGSKYEEEIRKKMGIYNPYLKHIEIKTYSSVEGSTEGNIKLQKSRAEKIAQLLSGLTTTKPETSIESRENWDDFYKQIERTRFQRLKFLPKDSIKSLLHNRKILDSLDYLLRKTRVANIVVDIEAVVDNNSSAYLILASYKKAILSGDSLRAFTCQQKLLQSAFDYQFSKSDIVQVDIPFQKKMLPVWTNYLAMAVQDTEMVYSYQARETAIKAIRIDSAYRPLQFNFCIMALKYLQLYSDTLIPVSRLESKMLDCFKMSDTRTDSILVNHMLLNYHILSAYKHWVRFEFDKIDPHLLGIKKYYPGAQITEYEALRLGLVFNLYTRTPWTIELLLPYMRAHTDNEELVFLFIQTYDDYHGSIPPAEWEGYLLRARKMNPKRFYEWIDKENFQYLRIPPIKKEFCEIKK